MTSVVTTIIGIVLLGYIGRRTMLLTGFAGVAVSQVALSLTFLLPESTTRSYVILACMVSVRRLRADVHRHLRVVAALGDLPAQHPRFRDGHRGVRAVVHQRDHLVRVPGAELRAGLHRDVLLFVAINVGSWLFVRKFVPETKGTTLEELEDRFEAEGLERAVATA